MAKKDKIQITEIHDDDSLRAYLRKLDDPRMPKYTHEAVIADGRAARDGDEEARNRLILGHLKYVISVADKFRGRGLEFKELVSAGNAGLVDVISRYDPDYKFDPNAEEDPEHPEDEKLKRNPGQLTTYAKFYIAQAIRVAIEEWNPPRPLLKNGEEPVTQREKMNHYIEVDLKANKNRRKRAKKEQIDFKKPISLDLSVYDDDSGSETLRDRVPDKNSILDPLDNTIDNDIVKILKMEIESNLTEEEKTYVKEYFGFEGERMFEWDIADKYGVDDLTVAKVINSAKLKLYKNKRLWDYFAKPGK